MKLSKHIGFEDIEILQKPRDFPYAHYRVYLLLKNNIKEAAIR